MALASRITARMRRSLGISHLDARFDALERLVASTASSFPQPHDGYPRGPVYFGDDTVLVATRWGAKMLVSTRDAAIAPWLALDGLWETQVTEWLRGALGPGGVFVDVGANVGYFTLLGGSIVGREGRVVAVVAHPRLADVLHRNVVMNGMYEFVTTHHGAAWSHPTVLTFYVRERFAGNSSAGSVGEEALVRLGDVEEAIEVDARPVDDLLTGLPRVDVIKIDVEGAELQVLTGLEKTFTTNPGVVVMLEWSLGQLAAVGTRPDEVLDLLDRHGFELGLLEDGGRPVSRPALLAMPYGNVVASR